MVERCARNLQRHLGQSDGALEVDDLVQFGYVGLLEARKRFDPSWGTDFRWFAQRRIRGAMLDGVRAMTPRPRRARQPLCITGLTWDDDIQFGDSLERALAYPPELVGDHGSLEDLVHDKRVVERICSMVGKLDEPDREIARRRILEGQPFAAITADLGCSRTWVWRVLRRACATLTSGLLDAGAEARQTRLNNKS